MIFSISWEESSQMSNSYFFRGVEISPKHILFSPIVGMMIQSDFIFFTGVETTSFKLMGKVVLGCFSVNQLAKKGTSPLEKCR